MGKTGRLSEQILFLKVEEAFAVWFGASRKFMLLEEPAFYVLKRIIHNIAPETIAVQCFKRYKNPIENCRQFVSEIQEIILPHLNSDIQHFEEQFSPLSVTVPERNFHSVRTYFMNGLTFRIKYGDKGLEAVVHPLIFQFENDENHILFHEFEIFRNSEKLFLMVENEIAETLESGQTGFLKAAVLLKFMELCYGKRNDDWMMTLHASAVTDGNRAVIFPARAGSGKSTLSVLLNAHGFSLLSDDFIAMDFLDKKVYSLPVAATIKEGSMKVLSPFYPELAGIQAEQAYTGKQVRYLPVNKLFTPKNGYPVKHFVFISYSQGSACRFGEISKKEALRILLEETWINAKPKVVVEFFKWFDKAVFFELWYSVTSEAVAVISKLFKQ